MKVYARLYAIEIDGDVLRLHLDSISNGKFIVPIIPDKKERYLFQVGDWMNIHITLQDKELEK